MGWMWSSQSPSSAPKGSNPPTDQSNNNKPAAPSPPPPPKQPESDYGDPEIAKFMAQLQAEFGSTSKPATTQPPPPEPTTKDTSSTPPSSSPSSTTPSQPSSSSTSNLFWSSSSPTTTPEPPIPSHLDPITESLLPTSMSCRQAFDAAYYCNSLGGQWISVYRSGTMRSCSEHWDDFWFCMRTRTYSGPQKEEAIRAHYRRKEYLKYHAPGRPSSADVWQPRDDKVQHDTAFRQHLDMPSISDEEWRRLEIERRRRVQEQLQSRES
ncbi:hypothetical protein F5Y00DRAFT_233927 [Daldinia vernicosa]|uniref:uncharacterized protein n=1 Tax=Daldinia vernicosa TaxID=114800 RepID=UPI002008E184|nr:uncharacterized protein F5Y00DRAFT_233927 [Daldinia vernicosa]KAI0850218.1 hypothetical protein F5Y00DRAFT_233927 [Daldinia vernicosa]